MRYSTKCSTLLIVLLAALAAPLLLRADGSGHGLKEAATTIAALHRQADDMQRTDPQGASQVLEQGLGLPLPPGDAARTLRADLHARIAQLKLLRRFRHR